MLGADFDRCFGQADYDADLKSAPIVAFPRANVAPTIGADSAKLERLKALISRGNAREVTDYININPGLLLQAKRKCGANEMTVYDSLTFAAYSGIYPDAGLTTIIERINQLSTTDNSVALLSQITQAITNKSKLTNTLSNIKTVIEEAVSANIQITQEQLIDFHGLVRNLLSAVEEHHNENDLKARLLGIFVQRAAAILNTPLDYDRLPLYAGNIICYELARRIFDEKSPYNVLFHGVLAARRVALNEKKFYKTWMNDGGNSDLPQQATKFIRDGNGYIHEIEVMVRNCIEALKRDNIQLNALWHGADYAALGSLTEETLQLLESKPSPTLRRLIAYTRQKDAQSKQSQNCYLQLVKLRAGLLEGDVDNAGGEYNAGAAAMVAIAEFADWFNAQTQDVRQKIKNVEYVDWYSRSNLGAILDVILDPARPRGEREREQPVGLCIAIKGQRLESCLNDRGAKKKLQAIECGASSVPRLQDDRRQLGIDKMQQVIVDELDAASPNVLTSVFGCQVDQQPNKYADTNRIIEDILRQTDNDRIAAIRQELLKPKYDYLRRHNYFSRYYGFFDNGRQKTSHSWARIEKAMAVQMMHNVIVTAQQTAPASLISVNFSGPSVDVIADPVINNSSSMLGNKQDSIDNTLQEHAFISNCRKWRFHFSASKTSRISTPDESAQQINEVQTELAYRQNR